MDARLIIRLLLGRGQFVNDAIMGIVCGSAVGVIFKLFGPAMSMLSLWIKPDNLSLLDWSLIGIAFVLSIQNIRGVRRISALKREMLDVLDELMERGKLSQLQRKQIYHNLTFRIAQEINLNDQMPSNEKLQEWAQEEIANETNRHP